MTGSPANVSNPQGGKSTDFSAGKCHLLYFVVLLESLHFGVARIFRNAGRGLCTWAKQGRFGSLFRALFPSTWRTLSPKCFVYQDSAHTQTPRICQIFVLSLLVSGSILPRNAYFSRQTLNCQIVPVLPSDVYMLFRRGCFVLRTG